MSGELTYAGRVRSGAGMRRACAARTLWAAAALVVGAGLGPGAWAQTTPEFDAWWAKMISSTETGPLPDGVKLTYRVVQVPSMTDVELQKLRAAVKTNFEHPDKPLIRLEELARAGKLWTDVSVWVLGGAWRYNCTHSEGQALPYLDMVRNGDLAWSLSPAQLTIGPLDRLRAAGQSIDMFVNNVARDTESLLNAGLSFSANRMTLTPRLSVDGKTWNVSGIQEASGKMPIQRVEARGRWIAAEGWGTVDELRWRNGDGPSAESGRTTTESWRFEPLLKRGIASVAREWDPAGREIQQWAFVKAETFTPQEFEALVRVPEPGGTDPVRGVLKLTSALDLRDEVTARFMAENAPVPAGRTREPSPLTSRGGGTLRTLGWVLLGLLIAAFVLIKIRGTK